MAGSPKGDSHGKLGNAILFSVICISLVLFLAPPELPRSALDSERLATLRLAGHSVERDIHQTSQTWYSGIVDRKQWHATASEVDLPFVNRARFSRYLNTRVDAAAGLIEIGLYRLASVWIWLLAALPLLGAVVLDAAMVRKARQHQFRYTSHTTQFTAGSAIAWLFVALVAGAFIPYPVPYVFSALMVIPLCGFIWLWMANLPKRL